jgi:hypothetical protein
MTMKMLLGLSGVCAVVSMLLAGFSREESVSTKRIENSIVISKIGNGKGSIRVEPDDKYCGVDCIQPVEISIQEGSVIKVIAIPADNSEFLGWSGGCRGRARECVVIIGSDTQITASFRSK